MRYLIEKMITLLLRLWSLVYPYKLNQHWHSVCDFLYTSWVRNFIGEVGNNTSFSRPLFLQGGGERRIKIGSNTTFGNHCILGCWESYGEDGHYEPEIIIGGHCSIGEYCHITAINKITIGDGLLTGRFVYIGDNAHGGLSWEEAEIAPVRRRLTSKGEIKIGRNVWIGDKVSIFGGVTIGDNVIIGAGSIVTHDIPSNCVAVGAPTQIVKNIKVKI